ncbi:hypothetical protein ACQEVX_35455 [Streptomyces syringium]|uniref:hypothetical protein n=1 Tax=Streptomyces syringium TaxID=76729 RepID=UPI003D8E11F5
MNWWLWTGVAAFCAATVCTEVYLSHRGTRSRSDRLGAYTDTFALFAGVLTLVLLQVLAGTSHSDGVSAWASAVFWGLAVTETVHLGRLKYQNRSPYTAHS